MNTVDFPAAQALIPAAVAERGTQVDDAWLHTALPAVLAARTPSYLTHAELVRVMEWKLKTGKFRPGLLAKVTSNKEDAVQRCSKAAFQALQGPAGPATLRAALTALTELVGVGPATASAVLCIFKPTHCAFMSDQSLDGLLGSRNYTAKECLDLAALCRAKAKELGGAWTAQSVQRAFWASRVAPAAAAAAAAGGGSASATSSGGGGYAAAAAFGGGAAASGSGSKKRKRTE